MQRAKRALALALVFALVASFCVTGAAADGGQTEQRPDVVYGNYSNGDWTQTEGGKRLVYGQHVGSDSFKDGYGHGH